MLNISRKLVFAFFLCIVGVFSLYSSCSAITVEVPIVSEVNSGTGGNFSRPVITGFTQPNTEVLIYFDGTYAGTAKNFKTGFTLDQYRYEQSKSLTEGKHKLMVISKDIATRVLSAPTREFDVQVVYATSYNAATGTSTTPAPTLKGPKGTVSVKEVKPKITGLTKNNTIVHVYIDDTYNGKIKPAEQDSGTANFAYTPFLNVKGGSHKVIAVAEDVFNGRESIKSEELNFYKEFPFPAPVLRRVSVSGGRAMIEGVAKSDAMVKIYIDKKLDSHFYAVDNGTGATGFKRISSRYLSAGKHLVYVTAQDTNGKVSSWSNIVYVSVKKPAVPKISSTSESKVVAVQPKKTVALEVKEKPEMAVTPITKEEKKEVFAEESTSKEETKEEAKTTDTKKSDIDKILDEIKGSTTTPAEGGKGIVDESSESQSKNKTNLAIFLVFLIGVIAWIFWVNRELIKEKREQSEKDEDTKKDDDNSTPSSNIMN
jgi:hypothetical protein